MSTRRFAVIDEYGTRVMIVKRGKVYGFIARWTQQCSGCTVSEDGHVFAGPFGCAECGYHGKVRHAMWSPLPKDVQKKLMEKRLAGEREARQS